MNFNKALCYITNRHRKLTLIRISDVLYSRSLIPTVKCSNIRLQKFSEEIISRHYRKLKQRNVFCFYSSAANEEQFKLKNPVITVPPVNFEDLTFEPPVTHSELCNALQICDSMEEQMQALTSTLALSPEDVENRVYFMKVIESLLKPFFGELKIQLFGSTLNGFGFKGCDIDMSFETFGNEKEKIDYLEAPDVPLVSEVMCGKVSPSEIASLPPKEKLLFIHSVLLEFYRESEEPTIFINAATSLVRFYHDKYGLKIDLTYKNKVAFANTKLLYLFGKLDDRVIPLMMTIRYWAKYVQLIGKGLMFNTYTISLLVIHFLQTRNPPILPSAEYLLSLSDSLAINDMSDTSFLQIRSHIPPSENKQTLSELLRDFFFYYLYFDFTRVICPLIGSSLSREEFLSRFASRRFRMNSIAVQDPMLATHNVGELVDYKNYKKFFNELRLGCNFFQDGTDLSPSPNKWGISVLLEKPETHILKYSLQKNISFDVPLITKQVISDCKEQDAKISTAETLLFLLRHILLFECKPLKLPELIEMLGEHDKEIKKLMKEIENRNEYTSELLETHQRYKKKVQISTTLSLQKLEASLMLEEFQSFTSKNKLLLSTICKTFKNSWNGRDHISSMSLPSEILNDFIEKERYISINAAKQNEINITDKKEKTKSIMFFFECYESPDLPESSVLLNFRTFQKTNFNPALGIFLKEYIPKLIQSINENC